MKYSRWAFVETLKKKQKKTKTIPTSICLNYFFFSWILKLISHPGNSRIVCVCMCLKAFQWLIDTQFTCRVLEIDESKCGASISESPARKLMGLFCIRH